MSVVALDAPRRADARQSAAAAGLHAAHGACGSRHQLFCHGAAADTDTGVCLRLTAGWPGPLGQASESQPRPT